MRLTPRIRFPRALLTVALPAALLLVPGAVARDVAPAPAQETASAGGGSGWSAHDFIDKREAVFEEFYAKGLDSRRPYAVTDLRIRKDNLTLLLKEGTLFLMKPVGGEVTGAAFLGSGVATMTPPNRTERYMLNKYYGQDTLSEPFTEAVFRFTDGTDRVLLAAARPDPGGAARAERAAEIFAERNGWLDGRRGLALEMQFLENRISALRGQDCFVAEIHSPDHDWLTYIHDPTEIKENELSASKFLGADRRYRVVWTAWHSDGDYGPQGHYLLHPRRDGPRNLRILHTDMNLDLRNTKTVRWDARILIEPGSDGLRCLGMDLDNNGDFRKRWWEDGFRPVRLQSVADAEGRRLEFMHKKDRLLILLAEPTRAGSAMTLSFKGTADVIYQVTAQSYGLLQNTWYPQYGYLGGRASFHWTARVPQPFLITGSGTIVRRFEDEGSRQNGIEFRCDEPAEFPWIIFGRFQMHEDAYTSAESSLSIPLSIHSFPLMTDSITDPVTLEYFGLSQPITLTLHAPVRKIKTFFAEGKEILKLFENIYGPYPYDELHIAQMSPWQAYGQAPQGFVQLWGIVFMSQAEASEFSRAGRGDFMHGLLAHEFAHQWWGHQIGWASGDDVWLSESFAEYAAGIFVKEFQGEKAFQKKLVEWRRGARVADAEGPIAAANTLGGPNAGRNRTYLLYNKGPYVLHMLRIQLGDEMYVKVMRSIQQTYQNQNISTEMLLREVNRVTGQNYTPFFDQWFWDVGIPKFHYSWHAQRQPDGKYLITVHVSQEDRDNAKKVLMPVYVHFKKRKIPQYRPVLKADQVIKILSPERPTDVTLDDERTLLADFIRTN
ncbi:MAG: M1 family metallopeptidase [Acidobacteriota bacterium]